MNATRTNELPRFLLDMLAAVPRAGDGVHPWLFKVSRQLWPHRTRDEIISLLKATVDGCGRAVPEKEIADAVDAAKDCAWQPRTASSYTPADKVTAWPKRNVEQIEALCAEGYGLPDLWEASPVRLEANEPHTEEIMDRLFPGDPLLCVGKYAKKPTGEIYTAFDTRPREAWRGELASLELVVPSPMAKLEGVTKKGKPSRHTLDATGPRHFLVIETDFSIFARDGKTETEFAPLVRQLDAQGFTIADMGAAVLLHLAQRAPLVLAVYSGGKSLHGWFFCAGQPEAKLRRFMEHAVALGADHATWCKSQFVRVPDGTRGNGNRQTVFFFDPNLTKP